MTSHSCGNVGCLYAFLVSPRDSILPYSSRVLIKFRISMFAAISVSCWTVVSCCSVFSSLRTMCFVQHVRWYLTSMDIASTGLIVLLRGTLYKSFSHFLTKSQSCYPFFSVCMVWTDCFSWWVWLKRAPCCTLQLICVIYVLLLQAFRLVLARGVIWIQVKVFLES